MRSQFRDYGCNGQKDGDTSVQSCNFRHFRSRTTDAVITITVNIVTTVGSAPSITLNWNAREGNGAASEIPTPIPPKSNAPSSSDRKRMEFAGVSFAQGIYHFEEYRYDKLEDALAYVALIGARR